MSLRWRSRNETCSEDSTAACSPTGMEISPKVMCPLQIALIRGLRGGLEQGFCQLLPGHAKAAPAGTTFAIPTSRRWKHAEAGPDVFRDRARRGPAGIHRNRGRVFRYRQDLRPDLRRAVP